MVVTSGCSRPNVLKVWVALYTSSVALVSTGLRLMYLETSKVCILRPPRPLPPRPDDPRPLPLENGRRPVRLAGLEKLRPPPERSDDGAEYERRALPEALSPRLLLLLKRRAPPAVCPPVRGRLEKAGFRLGRLVYESIY